MMKNCIGLDRVRYPPLSPDSFLVQSEAVLTAVVILFLMRRIGCLIWALNLMSAESSDISLKIVLPQEFVSLIVSSPSSDTHVQRYLSEDGETSREGFFDG